jgi:hypothetical protein
VRVACGDHHHEVEGLAEHLLVDDRRVPRWRDVLSSVLEILWEHGRLVEVAREPKGEAAMVEPDHRDDEPDSVS